MLGIVSRLHLTFHSLTAVCELFEEILNDALVVVAPTQDVIQCRKAMGLAGFLLMIKLLGFELVIADDAPVVACGVHREAGSERSIDANDHGVLTGTAVPGEVVSLHEVDHLPE